MALDHLNSQNFHERIQQASLPVLVDFWAPWCMPCRSLAPILENLAQECTGLEIYKINVEEAPELVEEFQILSIPTMLYFKDGEMVKRLVGPLPKNQIKKELGL